jgi:hypothetical protein
MHSGLTATNDLSRCPQAQADVRPENRRFVPVPSARFEAVPTHACDAVMWVFLMCTEASDEGDACLRWRERLVLEPTAQGPARALGDIDEVLGSNSGGLFVPFGFSRDDRQILLRAWMLPPGAGGGAAEYGYGVVARSTQGRDVPIRIVELGARDPVFYSGFGCAIGVTGSTKTPSYPQPGFPLDNGGALVVIDLATLRWRTVLEEPDTTYAVEAVDERAGTARVAVTRHRFRRDCPRAGQGALACSEKSSTTRTVALPTCAALPHR